MTSIAISFDDGADVSVAYKQLKRQYPKNRIVQTDIDIAEILALAMEREKNGSGKFYSEAEVMLELGITEQDIEEAEDLEIE